MVSNTAEFAVEKTAVVAYADSSIEKIIQPVENEENSIFNSCVLTARWLGVDVPLGDAEDLTPNNILPRVGGVVILKYWDPVRYHVAVIESVQTDGLHIAEGNYEKGKFTRRVIPLETKNIMGYYKNEN